MTGYHKRQCPCCSRMFDPIRLPPKDGDPAVCDLCGEVLVYADGLFVKPTEAHAAELRRDPEIEQRSWAAKVHTIRRAAGR